MKANKTKVMAALAAGAVLAAAQIGARAAEDAAADTADRQARKAQMRAAMLRKTGGFVFREDAAKGKVVFVDAQSTLHASNMTFVAAEMRRMTHFRTECVKGTGNRARELKEKFGADVLVAAVSDPDAPVLLVAPEEHWAAVNVDRLGDGLKSEAAKAKFVESRYRKELMRAFAFAAGGTSSQFPGNTMQTATLAELDLCPEMVPYDCISKSQAFMKKLGMAPATMATYRQACKLGWAAQPTNEIQKAIWDEVHAMPTAPIKIKPETKKVRD